MSENNLLIEIKNLRKVYQVPGGEVVALDGINLKIERGQIYGIIGMSGAGKSTLIRCMNRLDTPTEGQIIIDGQNILAMNEKQLMPLSDSFFDMEDENNYYIRGVSPFIKRIFDTKGIGEKTNEAASSYENMAARITKAIESLDGLGVTFGGALGGTAEVTRSTPYPHAFLHAEGAIRQTDTTIHSRK